MALLNCCSKFLATAEPMHAAPWVCCRFRLGAALRLRWSSMYLDRIVVVRCEEYITCAMSHRTGTQSYGAFGAWLKVLQKMVRHKGPKAKSNPGSNADSISTFQSRGFPTFAFDNALQPQHHLCAQQR